MATRSSRNNENSGGLPSGNIISFASIVTILFIILKLFKFTEVQHWSWVWVLSPLWMTLIAIMLLLMFLKWYDRP